MLTQPKLSNARLTELTAEFHSHCRAIIKAAREWKGKGSNPLAYAVGYSQAGLSLHSSEGIKTQCLYILANITHWRGPEATAARKGLKSIADELTPPRRF